jgi:hypothetical protein
VENPAQSRRNFGLKLNDNSPTAHCTRRIVRRRHAVQDLDAAESSEAGTSPAPSAARIRGRSRPTRPNRTDRTLDPVVQRGPLRVVLPWGPHIAAASASVRGAITCRPSPGTRLCLDMFFWYLLVTVAPFVVVSWRMPKTYPKGRCQAGTATQNPRDPGQPQYRSNSPNRKTVP